MRVVVWNCRQALHRKYRHLVELKPDLAIVPECASPDVLARNAPEFAYSDVEWRDNTGPTHGLGVFAFNGLRLRLHESWTPDFHLFLPIEVRGAAAFNLLAVWAFNHRAPEPKAGPNPVTSLDAVEHYAGFLENGRSLVAGDFNASVVWDEVGRYSSFSNLNARLNALGLTSAYHAFFKSEQLGAETRETHYHMYQRDRGFHIDYAYVPTELASNIRLVDVGTYDGWRPHSDHAPLVVDLDLAAAPAVLPPASRNASASRA